MSVQFTQSSQSLTHPASSPPATQRQGFMSDEDDPVTPFAELASAFANGVGNYVVGVAVLFFAFGVSVGLNLAAWGKWSC